MKKTLIRIVSILVVLGAITYFRWESIQQYIQQADETDAPPVVFVSAFIRSLINPLSAQVIDDSEILEVEEAVNVEEFTEAIDPSFLENFIANYKDI